MQTRVTSWVGVCGLLLSLSGCGWFGSEKVDSNSEDAIPELGEHTPSPKSRESANKVIPTENLELRLKVGDRFPLVKTVEQRLRQRSPNGGSPSESTSKLTMTLAITVEKIDRGVKTLGVRYQRVRYEHDIAGEKVSYDSALFPKTVPDAAQVYHGLLDNGFSFELGADNHIVKVHDFDAFLKRCVRHAPARQQKEMLNRLVATQEDEGIANFIDDSVGMLPYNIDDLNAGGDVKVGSSWRKNREIVRPFPMTIDTAYRLGSINDRYATLELFGKIVPAQIQHASNSVQQAGATENMTLRGGHCFGTCTIDRESGLPIQSHVTRQMDLTLQLPNGARFDQTKEIVTSIRTFPEQGAPTTASQGTTSKETSSAPGTKPTSRTAAAEQDGPVAAADQDSAPPITHRERSGSRRRDEKVVRPAGYQVEK